VRFPIRSACVLTASVGAVLFLGCVRRVPTEETQQDSRAPVLSEAARLSRRSDVVSDFEEWCNVDDATRARASEVVADATETRFLGVEWFSNPSGTRTPVACFRHADSGLEFVLVPGGDWELGDDRGSGVREEFVLSRRRVRLEAFLIARTEVPQGVWRRSTGLESPSKYRGERLPVDSVTWRDARTFCESIGGVLPTEAQWECAARAGSRTRFVAGDEIGSLMGFANVADEQLLANRDDFNVWFLSPIDYMTEFSDGFAGPSPVATFQPNGFGLYDVIGNVAEWCRDAWLKEPDWESASSFHRDADLIDRVVRGGSWSGRRSRLATSVRTRQGRGLRSESCGFRPVLEVPQDCLTVSAGDSGLRPR